jgi:hypothetical protein
LRETRTHRGHVFAGVGAVVVLGASAARLLIALVVGATPQEVAFPPNAPPLTVGKAAQLPRVVSLAPPASGPAAETAPEREPRTTREPVPALS